MSPGLPYTNIHTDSLTQSDTHTDGHEYSITTTVRVVIKNLQFVCYADDLFFGKHFCTWAPAQELFNIAVNHVSGHDLRSSI